MHLLKVMLKASGKKGVPQGGVISPLLDSITWILPDDCQPCGANGSRGCARTAGTRTRHRIGVVRGKTARMALRKKLANRKALLQTRDEQERAMGKFSRPPSPAPADS